MKNEIKITITKNGVSSECFLTEELVQDAVQGCPFLFTWFENPVMGASCMAALLPNAALSDQFNWMV